MPVLLAAVVAAVLLDCVAAVLPVALALLPAGDAFFLAMLACLALAAALVALAGLVVLVDVPIELTSILLLLVMLPFEPRLREWPGLELGLDSAMVA